MRDLSATQLLERGNRCVLQDVRRKLRVAHAPQDQGAQAWIVSVDCGQVRGRVHHGRRFFRTRGEQSSGGCLVINRRHSASISPNCGESHCRTRRSVAAATRIIAFWVTCLALPTTAASLSCGHALGAPLVTIGPLKTVGREPVAAMVTVQQGHSYLVDVTEDGNDAFVEVLDLQDQVLIHADHPERRTGTRRAVMRATGASVLVRVTGKEPSGVTGSASVRIFDLEGSSAPASCVAAFKALAQADADYAAGAALAGQAPSGDARAAFLRAAEEYGAAERITAAVQDHVLGGQAALAVAGVDYSDLQDWPHAAEWAQTAATSFGGEDPYRRARAEALRATAWMEIGSPDLLRRARGILQKLIQFHLERRERYDAGLQLSNVAVSYLYEGRYPECIAASVTSARLLGSIHESLRRAQAWQNQGVCLWGQGHLVEALRWFQRASHDIGPDALPVIYLVLTNNTALVNYALGNFDEALHIFDRALTFAEQVHSLREEARSLYGIGVTYYAIGDHSRARQFLERSLAIRTVALDRRGRVATLRSLASVDAEQGMLTQALALDSEALGLAVAPSAIARIRIQTAVHTASAGRFAEADALLNEVIADPTSDPLISAEALLQRGRVLRQLGRLGEARADLVAARARLHARRSISEAFEADLELARVLRLAGEPKAALKALDESLTHADAMRLQTANPELRMQLGTPLRAAYELKVELLRERYESAVATGSQHEANAVAYAAFVVADESRAHSLADFAALQYPAVVRRSLAGEFKRREELYQELAARRFALESRLDRAGSDDPAARQMLADIAELERQIDTVNSVIDRDPLVQRVSRQQAHKRENLPSLPGNTALLSYWLGVEAAYVWVVVPGRIQWLRLVSPASVEDAAVSFHRSLTRLVDVPPERRLQNSRTLYDMIIRPAAPALAAARQWVIVPDGALNYVPFAALQGSDTGASFVALKHDVAITPAAWMITTAMEPRTRRPGKLLLIDDPVYQSDDPRLQTLAHRAAETESPESASLNAPYHDLQRLPFTAEEARRILAEFTLEEVDELKGLQATRQRALSLNWAQYRFIHIAAHAVVDAEVPQLSALVLGAYDAQGERVEQAVRVSDLSLQTLTADVAVLSACDTALGPIIAEGTLGLESTLLSRGARAVVASIWPVPDQVSARLMTLFYQHLLGESMSAPAALGAAMRAVVSEERSADPALWAGFQVYVTTLDGPAVQTAAEMTESAR